MNKSCLVPRLLLIAVSFVLSRPCFGAVGEDEVRRALGTLNQLVAADGTTLNEAVLATGAALHLGALLVTDAKPIEVLRPVRRGPHRGGWGRGNQSWGGGRTRDPHLQRVFNLEPRPVVDLSHLRRLRRPLLEAGSGVLAVGVAMVLFDALKSRDSAEARRLWSASRFFALGFEEQVAEARRDPALADFVVSLAARLQMPR